MANAEEVVEQGNTWTEEKEAELRATQQRRGELQQEAQRISAEDAKERAKRAAADKDRGKFGHWFSTSTGIRTEFAVDTDTQDDLTRIVKRIFPAAKVQFSDAMWGAGPSLAASQTAAGQPVTPAAEVAGRADRARSLV